MTNLHEHRFAKGEKIITQGDVGDRVYLIRSGKVLVCREENGRMLPLSEVGPGQMFGEMYIYEQHSTRNASVVAVEETLVEVMFDESYRAEMQNLTPLQKQLVSGLNHRLNDMTDSVVKTMTHGKSIPEVRLPSDAAVFNGDRLRETLRETSHD